MCLKCQINTDRFNSLSLSIYSSCFVSVQLNLHLKDSFANSLSLSMTNLLKVGKLCSYLRNHRKTGILIFITAKFIDITSLINYLVLNEVRFNFNSIYCFVGKTSC